MALFLFFIFYLFMNFSFFLNWIDKFVGYIEIKPININLTVLSDSIINYELILL